VRVGHREGETIAECEEALRQGASLNESQEARKEERRGRGLREDLEHRGVETD